MCPSVQNAITLPPSTLANDSRSPLRQGESPVTSHEHTTNHIHHLNYKFQKPVSALLDRKQHRLNIVFEEYAWNGALADDVRLLGNGVLIGVDSARGIGRGRIDSVDGWDYGEEVLELVEVVGCCGDGAIERVEEGGVERSE